MLKDNKDEAFDLLHLALTSPHLDTADVERIRSQIMSGLHRDTTNPNSLASRKFLEIAFADHPYGRPGTGTLESVPTITVADMRDYIGRVIAKDTLKIAVVGDVDPATLGQLLDKTFGSLPAKANLTPVPDVVGDQAAAARLRAARRAADHDHLRRPRRHAPRSELHGRLYRQPHPGRRRAVVAALSRSPREARARLFGVRVAALDGSLGAVRRQHRHPRRPRRRHHRRHRQGSPPLRRGRPDAAGTGRGQVLPEGLADAAARHLLQARQRAAAIPARQAADRLYRQAQRHHRCRDAGRRQAGREAAVGPGPADRHRRPRAAGRRAVHGAPGTPRRPRRIEPSRSFAGDARTLSPCSGGDGRPSAVARKPAMVRERF